jgi:hypothetical protein
MRNFWRRLNVQQRAALAVVAVLVALAWVCGGCCGAGGLTAIALAF